VWREWRSDEAEGDEGQLVEGHSSIDWLWIMIVLMLMPEVGEPICGMNLTMLIIYLPQYNASCISMNYRLAIIYRRECD